MNEASHAWRQYYFENETMKKQASFSVRIVISILAFALAGCPAIRTPISMALDYLWQTQVKNDLRLPTYRDYAGDWPQFMSVAGRPNLRIRDVSPFIPAFIHHGLTFITAENLDALELSYDDVARARLMRQQVVSFIKRFESASDAPDAGAYGFWPVDTRSNEPHSPLIDLSIRLLKGPVLQGSRVPLNIGFFPGSFAIPADCDVTAAAYVTFLNDARLDSGPAVTQSPARFFADWRDVGLVPRRLNPGWLPAASGAFLTWFNYLDPPVFTIPNDVDAAVNANVLHALARFGQLFTPGAQEAISLINYVVREGLYNNRQSMVTPYYRSNSYIFHFFVTRAFQEGPVPGLQPAAGILADEIQREAVTLPRGMVCWDRGFPHFDTALCLLALMQAGRNTGLIEKGIKYLINEQHPVQGYWEEAAFFIALTDGGVQFNWGSRALTTAMALEALCRFRLAAK